MSIANDARKRVLLALRHAGIWRLNGQEESEIGLAAQRSMVTK
jgi:hypothetical protein